MDRVGPMPAYVCMVLHPIRTGGEMIWGLLLMRRDFVPLISVQKGKMRRRGLHIGSRDGRRLERLLLAVIPRVGLLNELIRTFGLVHSDQMLLKLRLQSIFQFLAFDAVREVCP